MSLIIFHFLTSLITLYIYYEVCKNVREATQLYWIGLIGMNENIYHFIVFIFCVIPFGNIGVCLALVIKERLLE